MISTRSVRYESVVRVVSSILVIVALTSACATQSRDQSLKPQDATAERLDAYVLDDSVRHDVQNADVARLWQESQMMRRSGNNVAAKEKIQQAISITPRDPALWSSAAELELEENSNLRAENYAAKSNFLTTLGNKPLRYRNWLIIQRAREARGDMLGAREAERESVKLVE